MHRSARTLALAATLLGLAAGCRSANRGDPETAEGAPAGPAVVVFTNQGLNLATVYAIRPGGDVRRIGSVPTGRTESLVLPRDLAYAPGPITIIAVPLATNRAASSGPVTVRPGDRLSVTLPASENALSVLPILEP